MRSASSKHYYQQMQMHHACGPQHWPVASTTDGSAYLTVQVSPLRIILCTCKCSSARLQDPTPAPSMTVPIEHSSRPTLGFPLGTALLLLVIFSLSGMFSCCYHWDKLRSLLRSRHPAMFQEGVISITSSPSKETPDHKLEKVGKECGLPVIMPGDKVPKFFARPCPHETCLPEAEKTEAPLETICICTSSVHESTLRR